jgi:hypothetical protein
MMLSFRLAKLDFYGMFATMLQLWVMKEKVQVQAV